MVHIWMIYNKNDTYMDDKNNFSFNHIPGLKSEQYIIINSGKHVILQCVS